MFKFVDKAEFCLAQMWGLHIVAHADDPKNIIQYYQNRWERICTMEQFVFVVIPIHGFVWTEAELAALGM